MSHTCPDCAFGTLKPIRITFMREWAGHMVTLPNFAAWQCDSCGHTLYDQVALAKLEVLLGPDVESMMEPSFMRWRTMDGPDARGPHRRSL